MPFCEIMMMKGYEPFVPSSPDTNGTNLKKKCYAGESKSSRKDFSNKEKNGGTLTRSTAQSSISVNHRGLADVKQHALRE